MFEIQWRDNSDEIWEPQWEKKTRNEANDWIAEQPEGGMYRVVELDRDDE